MNIKRVVLILLIAVAVISSVGAVSAGLFDDLFGGADGNVVEIENFTFETINETNFTYDGMIDDWKSYVDKNECCVVYILNTSQMNDSEWKEVLSLYQDDVLNNLTMQNISGVEICNETVLDDDGSEQIWYESFIVDKDHKTIVELLSIDLNETVKMASTFKCK